MEMDISAKITGLGQKIDKLHSRCVCEPLAEARELSNDLEALRQEFEHLINAQERYQTERRRAEAAILAQRDLSLSLASTRSLEEALQLCLDAAIQVSGLDSGGIYLVDSSGGLSLACARNLSSDFLAGASSIPADSDRWRLVQVGRPIYVSYQDPGGLPIPYQAKSHLINEGLQGIAIIPVLHQSRIIACFNVSSHTIPDVPEPSRYALETIAAQVGSAIARIQAEDALRENQEEIQMLFDTIQDMLFVFDANGRIRKVNRNVVDRLGYSEEEIASMSVFDLYPPERRMDAAAIVEQMIAGQREFCPIPLLTRDGTLIPVETKVTLGHWGDKDMLIGISRDITERKSAEKALREKEEFIRSVLTSLKEQISVLDRDGNIVAVNSAWERFAAENGGHTASIGLNYLEVCRNAIGSESAEEAPLALAGIQGVLDGTLKEFSLEYPCHSPEEKRWFLMNAMPLTGGAGGAVVSHIAITERKQAEEALQDSKDYLDKILNSIGDPIFVKDKQYRYALVNDEYCRFVRRKRSEIIGKTSYDLYPKEQADIFRKGDEDVFESGRENVNEERITDTHGIVHTIITKKTLYTDAAGDLSLVAVVRDITERKQAEEALQESEELFRSLVDNMLDSAIIIDWDGKVLFANNSAVKLIGLTPPLDQGINVLEMVSPDQTEHLIRDLGMVREGHGGFLKGYRIRTISGEEKWVECLGTRISFKGRSADLVTLRDVTERKLMEEALRESERKYREFADSLPQIVYELDCQGNFIFANRSAYASIGLSQQESKKGLNILQTLVPEDRERVVRNVHKILEGEKIEGQEYQALRKDESSFPVVTYSSAIIKDGRAVGLRGVAVDISDIKRAQEEIRKLNVELEARVLERTSQLAVANEELQGEIIIRKRTEEALQESEERFRRLAENAPDVIFHIDLLPEPHLTYISPAIVKTCKYSPDELLASPDLALELINPGGREAFEPQNLAQISSDKPIVLCWRARDGGHIWTEQRRVPVYDPSGNLVAIEGIVRDITEWVKADEKIKASLREKEVMLKEIHHRVKNNLQIISSLLSIQSRQIEDPAAQEILNESRDRVKSLALVHENLYQSPDLGMIDFTAYIKKLAFRLASSYRINGQIALKVDADEVYLGIDMAIPCGLILNELITNSLKHAFPDGSAGAICIDFRRYPDGWLILNVGDNGIGMPADVDIRKARSMGMMLISSLVSQLGGTIELSSVHGTRFEIKFLDRPH